MLYGMDGAVRGNIYAVVSARGITPENVRFFVEFDKPITDCSLLHTVEHNYQVAVREKMTGEKRNIRIFDGGRHVTRIWPDLAERDSPAMSDFAVHIQQVGLRAHAIDGGESTKRESIAGLPRVVYVRRNGGQILIGG